MSDVFVPHDMRAGPSASGAGAAASPAPEASPALVITAQPLSLGERFGGTGDDE